MHTTLTTTLPADGRHARIEQNQMTASASIRFRKAPSAEEIQSVIVTRFGDDRVLDWRDLALCAETDPDIFFPEKGESGKPAKAICRGCPVREQCLDYALANDERFGVWGGLSERERRGLKGAA